MCPLDPFELVTYAKLGTTVGEFYNSGNFHQQSTPWGANTLVLTGAPLCKAWATDNLGMVGNADRWNSSHRTSYLGGTENYALALDKILYLRAGEEWYMAFSLDFGAVNHTDRFTTTLPKFAHPYFGFNGPDGWIVIELSGGIRAYVPYYY